MVMFITALTLLFAVYPTVVNGKCCGPQQWLASLEQISSSPQTSTRAKIAYDAVNKMFAMNVSDLDGKPIFKVWNNYKTNTSYSVVNETCTKSKVLAPLPPRCVPDDAKVVGESYLGAGNNTLHYKTYQYKMFNSQVFAALTKDCIPISWTLHRGTSVGVVLYSGIIPDIKDLSVFDVPAICKRRVDDKLMKADAK